jgi:CBS-domain-containing membrane protein
LRGAPGRRGRRELIGILTDRDICISAWSRGQLLANICAGDAMCRQVYAVKADQEIGLAELLLAEHQIRRLLVVDANGKPIGVVSMNDFAREAARPGSRIKMASRGRSIQSDAARRWLTRRGCARCEHACVGGSLGCI